MLVDAAAVRRVGAHPAVVAALLTIQNGVGFFGASPREPEEVARTMEAVLATGAVGAVKTGALGDGRVVRAVARVLESMRQIPLVVDPVLASSSGGALIDRDGVEAMLELLVPRAALVTPNLAEAAALVGFEVADPGGMARAAREIGRLGARAVLVKGGHLVGTRLLDMLWTPSNEALLEADRLPEGDVRGTGCALAAAAGAGLALGEPVERAVELARAVVRGAIGRAVRAGEGPRVLVFD